MSLLGKALLFLALAIALFFMWMQFARADSVVNIMNMTVKIDTSSNVIVNLSGYIFSMPNVNSTLSFQQNFSVSINGTNVTTFINTTFIGNVTCNNSTLQVSCTYPTFTCPSVINATCNPPDVVDLKNETKTLFFDTYKTGLSAKIEEASNKATQDIVFQLSPTKVELQNYKDQAFNASIAQKDAEAKTASCNANNLALTSVYEGCNSEKKLLQLFLIVFFAVVFLGAGVFFGPQIVGRFKGLGGGGGY